jgi:hypothetical protein
MRSPFDLGQNKCISFQEASDRCKRNRVHCFCVRKRGLDGPTTLKARLEWGQRFAASAHRLAGRKSIDWRGRLSLAPRRAHPVQAHRRRARDWPPTAPVWSPSRPAKRAGGFLVFAHFCSSATGGARARTNQAHERNELELATTQTSGPHGPPPTDGHCLGRRAEEDLLFGAAAAPSPIGPLRSINLRARRSTPLDSVAGNSSVRAAAATMLMMMLMSRRKLWTTAASGGRVWLEISRSERERANLPAAQRTTCTASTATSGLCQPACRAHRNNAKIYVSFKSWRALSLSLCPFRKLFHQRHATS